jgi:hypothetical protein
VVLALYLLSQGFRELLLNVLTGTAAGEELVRKYGPPLTALAIPVCAGLSWYFLAAPPAAPPAGTVPPATVAAPQPAEEPLPETVPDREGVAVLRGRVLDRSSRKPIADAVVRLDQDEAHSGADGTFALTLSAPSGTSLCRVTHDDYQTDVVAVQEKSLARRLTVRLQPRKRLLVAELEGTSPGEGKRFRRILENRFARCKELALVSEDVRPLIRQFVRYQNGRVIFARDKVPRPKLLPASYVVFSSLGGRGGRERVECTLVELETGAIKASTSTRVERPRELARAVEELADRLVAHLCEIRILCKISTTPRNHVITLKGFAPFRPDNWMLWISVLPHGTSRHYPQQPVTWGEDGIWIADSVAIGGGDFLRTPVQFTVFAALVDQELNGVIETYHKECAAGRRANEGLDLTKWMPSSCRLLDKDEVIRCDVRREQ